jgi:hypothetical protein
MNTHPSDLIRPLRNAHGAARDERLLPRLENDRPVVLLAGAVLGEQAREVTVVDGENHHTLAARDPCDAIAGEAAAQKRLGLVDDRDMPSVEEDAQTLCARESCDMAVAEVEPEQLGVVGRREADRASWAPAARAGLAEVGRRRDVPRASPVADRRAGDAEAAGDLAIVDSRGDELDRCCVDRLPVHEHMFAFGSDVRSEVMFA